MARNNNNALATVETNEVELVSEVIIDQVSDEPKVYTLESAMEEFKTTSSAIRGLAAHGMSRGAIAKLLNKRYQHVRNVLITPIKKAK